MDLPQTNLAVLSFASRMFALLCEPLNPGRKDYDAVPAGGSRSCVHR